MTCAEVLCPNSSNVAVNSSFLPGRRHRLLDPHGMIPCHPDPLTTPFWKTSVCASLVKLERLQTSLQVAIWKLGAHVERLVRRCKFSCNFFSLLGCLICFTSCTSRFPRPRFAELGGPLCASLVALARTHTNKFWVEAVPVNRDFHGRNPTTQCVFLAFRSPVGLLLSLNL